MAADCTPLYPRSRRGLTAESPRFATWAGRAVAAPVAAPTCTWAVATPGGSSSFAREAASRLAVKAARLSFSLPYFHAHMSLAKGPDGAVQYGSERRAPGRASERAYIRTRYRAGAKLGASRPDTLEHFLFERYLLHVIRRGALHTGQVHHTPYPVFQADIESCEETLIRAVGLPPPTSPPALSHFCPGVDVEIFALQRQALRQRS